MELQTAAARLQASFEGDPRLEEYLSCGEGAGDCASLYLDVTLRAAAEVELRELASATMNGVRDQPLERAAIREDLIADLLVSRGAPDSQFRRFVALSYLDELDSDELPQTAYADLDTRPLTEVILLAKRHYAVALPTGVAREFAALADVADDRVRRSVIRALGHQETANELHQALLAAPIGPSDWVTVGAAIRECGSACDASLDYLLSLDDEPLRRVLYEQVGFASKRLSARLMAVKVGSEEARIREEFFNDTSGSKMETNHGE